MRGTKIHLWYVVAYAMFVALACIACIEDSTHIKTHQAKVVVLMQETEQQRWEETARWALQNIAIAQKDMDERVQLQLVFKNQDDEDVEEYIQQLVEEKEVMAVIGPTTSDCAMQVAMLLSKNKIPMISPSATSVEYQRRFADVPYIWNMAESDIVQLEVILAGIAARLDNSNKSVMLLTADDRDGQEGVRNAYAEWFGFIAEEYGLDVDGVYLYKSVEDVRDCVRDVCGTDWRKANKALLFNPSSDAIALAFDEEIGVMKSELQNRQYLYIPQLYCSDAFVSDEVAEKVTHATYEGVDLYALPTSGYLQAYKQRFGRDPLNGEAQFYDAICLVAYGTARSLYSGESLNEAILSVVDGRDGKGESWLPADMDANFRDLQQGVCPDIDGVSSTWTFDKQTHASVIGSTFRRWRLYDGCFLTTEYVSTDGGGRTSSSKAMWEWTASTIKTFEAEDTNNLTYPILNERWALLVAASEGWSNYRFQADVFAMYKLLKVHGYEDDHIVMIAEDDIATHEYNIYPNALFISHDGENVYEQSGIDYRLSEIHPSDIGDILQGRSSEKLSHVLSPKEDDNVFVFWSGHGGVGSLNFGKGRSVSYQQMRNMIENTPHRKLLFVIEACYSGGLGDVCIGIPGSLFITAAGPYETSHASVWNEELGVYLTNGFTRGFQDAIDENPSTLIRDLYYSLARNTAGSHVQIYNILNYGNIYKENMREFLE